MITANEIKKGTVLRLNGEVFTVIDSNHHKPGKGHAMVRTKLRNIKKGSTMDHKFGTSEKIEDLTVEKKNAQFSYDDGENFIFMDLETYDQIPISSEVLGDGKNFLVEETEVTLDILDNEVINVQLPNTMVFEVTFTEPGLKGDTVGGASKPATVSTGYELSVPLFVNIGDKLRIDTRNGEYVERVND